MSKPSDLYGRPWSEREYIIVLHSYLANRNGPRHHLCDYVKEIAGIIGRTPGADEILPARKLAHQLHAACDASMSA